MTESSASLGHAVTHSEVRGQSVIITALWPYNGVLNHLRDGPESLSRGITSRLTFECRLEARDL